MQSHQANRSGSAILDGAPPSPPEKIFPSSSAPGADTSSLLGSSMMEPLGGTGSVLQQPQNKLLLAVAMFMQSANLAESISPGFVPEPVKMWIASAMEQAPMMVEQMSRQPDPLSMMAAAQSGMAGPQGMSPMGASPMSAAPTPGSSMGMTAMGMPGLGGRMMGGAGGKRPLPPEEEEY